MGAGRAQRVSRRRFQTLARHPDCNRVVWAVERPQVVGVSRRVTGKIDDVAGRCVAAGRRSGTQKVAGNGRQAIFILKSPVSDGCRMCRGATSLLSAWRRQGRHARFSLIRSPIISGFSGLKTANATRLLLDSQTHIGSLYAIHAMRPRLATKIAKPRTQIPSDAGSGTCADQRSAGGRIAEIGPPKVISLSLGCQAVVVRQRIVGSSFSRQTT